MFSRHEWDGAPLCDQTFGPRYVARSTLIRKVLAKVRPSQALDIGCGSGNVTRHLADFSDHVHAIDISERAVEVAQENLRNADNISFEAIDVFAVPESEREHLEGHYDLVMLSEVLEHIDADEDALANVARLLRSDGRLLLTVPADPSQWSVEDELAGHKRRYTKQELCTKLERAGFQVEKMVNWGFPFTRPLLAVERKLMGSRQAHGASGTPMQLLLRPAKLLFRLNGAIEPYLSFFNAGIGYVVLARRTEQESTTLAVQSAA
jgi:SAM-dependent methyltransferase